MNVGKSLTSVILLRKNLAFNSPIIFRLILLGGLLVILVALPISLLERIPLCVIRHFLNIDCPGCGLLRSGAAFFTGNWQASISYFPLGPFIFLGLLLYLIEELAILLGMPVQQAWGHRFIGSRWCLAAVLLIFMQWIAKLGGIW